MRIHCLQHVSFESPGRIAAWCAARGHELAPVRLFAHDAVPSPSEVKALVVMGGPMSVHDDAQHAWMQGEKRLIGAALEAGKPVFGVCLGAQLVALMSGVRVYRNRFQEIGWFPVESTPAGVEWGLPHTYSAFHWHGDTFYLPAGAANLARTDACEHQMFALGDDVIGIQFHLEVTREDVAAMCDHAGHDLPDGPFVQTADTMRDSTQAFASSHRLLETILDRWMGGWSE
jgi:GMP synthase-like glutamine amidotransferase